MKWKIRRIVETVTQEKKKLIEGPDAAAKKAKIRLEKKKVSKANQKELSTAMRKKRKLAFEEYEKKAAERSAKRQKLLEGRNKATTQQDEQQTTIATTAAHEPALVSEPEPGVGANTNTEETATATPIALEATPAPEPEPTLTEEPKKLTVEEELRQIQEEEDKRKKEQLQKYLQRVAPVSVFKRVAAEQAKEKEIRKFFFSSLNIPLVMKKGANSLFPQMTPTQHQIIHCTLNREDVRVTRTTEKIEERVVAYLVPILSRLINVNHQSGLASLILAPTIETAKEIYKVAEKLLRFHSKVSAPFIKIFTKQFKMSKTFLQTGHCHVLITTPQLFLWHLNTTKFSKSLFSYLVIDEAEKHTNMEYLRQVIADLPDNRQSLVFANELNPTVLKIANFTLKPNYTKIKQQEANEQEQEKSNEGDKEASEV